MTPTDNGRIQILQTLQRICSQVTGIEEIEIKPSSSFFDDLGVGMEEFAEILSQVSMELKIKISKQDAAELHTVGDLLDFIEEQL